MKTKLWDDNCRYEIKQGILDLTKKGMINDLEFCSICGDVTKKKVYLKHLNKWFDVFPECSCKQKEYNKQDKQREELENKYNIINNKKKCFDNGKMINWNFDNSDTKNTDFIGACKNYVENFDYMDNQRKWIYLYGKTGSGKTYASSCIANYLIEKGYSCKLTSFIKIEYKMSQEFYSRSMLIDELMSYDLLIIDDYKAERNTQSVNEIIYAIINGRYEKNKPVLITSNVGISSLKRAEDEHNKRIVSRLQEMCIFVKNTQEDRRKNIFLENSKK